MTIKYNEYDLLEFFEDFPKFVDNDAEIYDYSYRGRIGHIFSLHISTFEDTVVLTLEHEKLRNPIIDITLKRVDEIKVDKEKLTIVIDGEPFVQVYLKPSIAIKFLKLQS